MAKAPSRQIKVYSKYRSDKVVPELRLMGVWLEACGFKIGDLVKITVKNQELIIKPIAHGD